MSVPSSIPLLLESLFRDRLARQRNASRSTIASYRDALRNPSQQATRGGARPCGAGPLGGGPHPGPRQLRLSHLVERTTRFTMLLHLPSMAGHGDGLREKNGPALAGHGAEAVRDAIAREITTLPEQLRRTAYSDDVAQAFRNDLAHHSDLMSPGVPG